MDLSHKYYEYISPIISAIDYEWASNEEVKQMINEIENIRDIDRLLIYFIMFSYYLRDDY
jgi:endoglucanase Acf2